MDCPKRNALAGLPDEAMLEILARTPFRSVCRSKCVAKAWRDLIDDPLNRGRLPQTLQGFFSIFDRTGNLEQCFVEYSASFVPRPLDVDPCFSFLTKLPEIERLCFVDYCNGLLLFLHFPKSNPSEVLGYIVCNPTTKHWATVRVGACCLPSHALLTTYLAFNPAVSSHFHLVHFWKGGWGEDGPLAIKKISMLPLSVHTYSSETGVWTHNLTDWNEQGQLEGWRRQGRLNYGSNQRTFVNGILHLMVSDQGSDQIVAVGVEGRTKRTIKLPAAAKGMLLHSISSIGQSQGRLLYIFHDSDAHDSTRAQSHELSIWVLQDYDAQEWVLKDTVSFLRLFGRMAADLWAFNIIDIHPDRNVVFFRQRLNRLVIAYDMDSKEVSVVATISEKFVQRIVPYIPYFSESPALTNKN